MILYDIKVLNNLWSSRWIEIHLHSYDVKTMDNTIASMLYSLLYFYNGFQILYGND